MFLRFGKILKFSLGLAMLFVCCKNCDLPMLSKKMSEGAEKPVSAEIHSNFKKISPIKSIYFNKCSYFQLISETLERYGANAVVVDVKDDLGQLMPLLPVTYNEKNRFMPDQNFKSLLKKFKEKKIYTIARVVALKELTRGDLCIKGEDGSVMIDKEKMSWMDPRDEKVQRYLEEICTAAIKIGFDEVQLDYVRFSTYFRDDLQNKSRIKAVNNLTDRITAAVHKLGGKVSVCVFGCTIDGSVDTPDKKNQTQKSSEILGQDYVELAEIADYICPMIYPSHYPKETPCGIKFPDLEPYNTVSVCMKLSNDMLKSVGKQNLKAKVRPYLQAFTAKWLEEHLEYGKSEINDQIRAVQDSNSVVQWGLFCMAERYP